MTKSFIFILSTTLILSACVTAHDRKSAAANIDLPVVTMANQEDYRLPYNESAEALLFSISPHGGDILGLHSSEEEFLAPSTTTGFSKEQLFGRIKQFANRSEPIRKNDYLEISITPEETRLSRVVILAYDSYLYMNDFRRDIGYTGLKDTLSNNDLLPLYVDRPCSIKGVIRLNNETAEFDVEIPRPGLHLLIVERKTPGIARVKFANQDIRPAIVVDTYASYREWLSENPPSLGESRKVPQLELME
ncbi:hypothetical protein OPU71_06495 [Niveibacterium sp. 24ML]|uniref:hypothetical protein n=1 Tax=Niveibacterium sp. 24ML TaxID=2985512 RepID=UPI002271CC52|nr:hypothetical protein [Niveibacterium sp. 24ML]MCX9155774.1 hypothetical protein [Niveibacterium sp. 24ML]